MAIAKKPTSKSSASGISGKKTKSHSEDSNRRIPFMIRCPSDLLERIDLASKQRGVSRSAWLLSVASRALDRDDY